MKLTKMEKQEGVKYSSQLEVGDYLPYFYIENDSSKLDVQVKATNYLLFITTDMKVSEQELLVQLKRIQGYLKFVILARSTVVESAELFVDANVHRLFHRENYNYSICLCNRNLKILSLTCGNDISDLVKDITPEADLPKDNVQPPVLVIPNAISADLANSLIEYIDAGEGNLHQRTGSYKSRDHVHPPKELLEELDDKLCKSVLPEISKVFYNQITHRESYKICRYDARDEGCFGKHRDTIDPYLHRRFAMTLVLNDEYQGGGICFPEYSDQIIEAPNYSAIVFSGSLYHQVVQIESGRRYVLISFFFTDSDARPGKYERYRFGVERDVSGITLHSLMPSGE